MAFENIKAGLEKYHAEVEAKLVKNAERANLVRGPAARTVRQPGNAAGAGGAARRVQSAADHRLG